MRRSKEYQGLRFKANAIKRVFGFFDRFLLTDYHKRYEVKELTTQMCGMVWEYYSDNAFFDAYIPWVTDVTYKRTFLDYEFMLFTQERSTFIGVKAHTLMQIQPIFDEVEKNIPQEAITWNQAIATIRPYIILGHGRGESWKSVVDYLYVKHGYGLRCYEMGGTASRGLDKAIKGCMLENIMALIVIEGEDHLDLVTQDQHHKIYGELKYLKETLGISRVLFIVERGVNAQFLPQQSNILMFKKGHIKELFLLIAGKVRKEFT